MSQNKLRAIFTHVFSEQVGVLKIIFVSYIRDILTDVVQEAIPGNCITFQYDTHYTFFGIHA